MIYGSKLSLLVLLLSFFLITITGCESNKNFSYELYDGYEIKSIDGEIKLYKDDLVFKINDLDYQIKTFKYNSDVVCLKLNDGSYYMIYYVDGSIYGPHTLSSLNETITSLSMEFNNDFRDINKVEGRVYEW